MGARQSFRHVTLLQLAGLELIRSENLIEASWGMGGFVMFQDRLEAVEDRQRAAVAARIAKTALATGRTVRELAIGQGLSSEDVTAPLDADRLALARREDRKRADRPRRRRRRR